MSTRTSRAAYGTLTSFLQYGLHIALQIALAPLILQRNGKEVLGAYAALMQAIGYLALVDLGFSVATSRYLAQSYGYDDQGASFGLVMSTARTFALFSNLAFGLLCALLSVWIAPLLGLSDSVRIQAQIGLYLLAAWSVLRTPMAVYGSGLIATQNLAAANCIAIVGNTGRLIFSVALVMGGAGLVGLMLANVLAESVTVLLQAGLFRRRNPNINLVWGIRDRSLFVEMLRFGAQALLINVAGRLVFYTDNLVVGYLYGAAAVSIYYTTQMPGTILYQPVLRLTDNSAPAINELYAREMPEARRNAFLRLHRYTWMLIAPVATGVLFLSRPLISLWVGAEQYAGQSMVTAIAIFSLVFSVAHVSDAFVMATGRIRLLTILASAEGIANLVLSLILGRMFGLSGVMWGTVIANLPTSVYLYARGQREVGVTSAEYIKGVLGPIVLPCVGLVIVLAGWIKTFPPVSWIGLLALCSVTMLTYGFGVYRYSLSKEERIQVLSHLRVEMKAIGG